MARRWAMVAVIGFAGCESLKTSPAPAPTEPIPVLARPAVGATPSSRAGDVSPPVSPISFHRGTDVPRSPADEPEPAPDPLSLAAECLVRGDHANAAVHLESHVREHPDQVMFRAQLADLLVRVGREETAKVHYERFAIDARRSTGVPRKHLVHVHTRLMELAQRDGDRSTEVFHRGVGLLLLTEEQDGLPDRDEGFCEEMLCKAMKALTEAKELNPGDARVRLRLAEVYDRMGNRRAADAERAVARTAVLPSGSGPILTLRE